MNPVAVASERAPAFRAAGAPADMTVELAGAPSEIAGRDSDPAVARSRDRHRRVAVTTLSAIGPKLLSLAILLVGARFVAATLPSDGFGVWLLLITASGLLGFADLGLGNGLLNEVAAANGRDDLGAMRRAISSASAALVLVAAILLGAFLVTIPIVSWSQVLGRTRCVSRVGDGRDRRVRRRHCTRGRVRGCTTRAARAPDRLGEPRLGRGRRRDQPGRGRDRSGMWREPPGPRRCRSRRTAPGGRGRHHAPLRLPTARTSDPAGHRSTGWTQLGSVVRVRCSASWRWPSRSVTSPTRW